MRTPATSRVSPAFSGRSSKIGWSVRFVRPCSMKTPDDEQRAVGGAVHQVHLHWATAAVDLVLGRRVPVELLQVVARPPQRDQRARGDVGADGRLLVRRAGIGHRDVSAARIGEVDRAEPVHERDLRAAEVDRTLRAPGGVAGARRRGADEAREPRCRDDRRDRGRQAHSLYLVPPSGRLRLAAFQSGRRPTSPSWYEVARSGCVAHAPSLNSSVPSLLCRAS